MIEKSRMTFGPPSAYDPAMSFAWKPALIAGMLVCGSLMAIAQEDMPKAPVNVASKGELDSAIETETISVPTPGELFVALEKQTLANWSSYYREPIPTAFSNRAQIALALGTLLADGYVAVEAMDPQQVKNVGSDLMALAKSLGVGDDILARGNSITNFAENNDWNTLMEELEATQNEVRRLMVQMRDQDLVVLVNLGGWIRGAEVVSSAILDDYRPESARILRQPELVQYLRQQLDELAEPLKRDPLVKQLREQLIEIETLLQVPQQSEISEATVETLRDLTGELTTAISSKN